MIARVCLFLGFVATALCFGDGTPFMISKCSTKDPHQVVQKLQADQTIRLQADGKCFDISNYGTTPGTVVQVWSCHTDDRDPNHQNQEWVVQGPNIVNPMSKMCMSTTSATPGASVVLGDCSSDLSQFQFVSTTSNLAQLMHVKSKLCVTVGGTSNPCLQDAYKSLPFCDYSQSIDTRVRDLLARIPSSEKVGLLGNGAQGAPSVGWGSYQWWSEALHGVANSPGVSYSNLIPSSTSFPQVCTTGATFDPDLFRQIGAAIGVEARAMSNQGQAGLTFWAPNLNIFRDPRWGRGQETPGEDPFLTSTYVRNFVHAVQYHQNDTNHLLASSCCKHYAAYSLENWGGVQRYAFNAVVTAQDLADTYTPAFEACVHKDGGAASGMMCSYNAVNGIPSCANTYLLTGLARQAWGFDGYITSDCGATDDVLDPHHYTNTTDGTCQATLRAGMDLDCGSFLQSHTAQALQDGAVGTSDLDTALGHLFRVQMRLGMFDPVEKQPFLNIPPTAVNTPYHQYLALVAAEEGIVLLENKGGVLPLNASNLKTVAVVGPNSDDGSVMQGNYYGQAPYLITPRIGIAERVATVQYAKGCSVTGTDKSGFAGACSATNGADAIVVVIGMNPDVESEGNDRTAIDLPGVQQAFVDNLVSCADPRVPIIVVLMSGGPLDVSAIRSNPRINALLWVGYPGQSGGKALANILFGDVPPSGRLPYTVYPKDYVNQISMFDMNMRPNATTKSPGRTYRFYTGTPVYPFGYGLAYTSYSYAVAAGTSTIPASRVTSALARMGASTIGHGPLHTVSYRVQNTGRVKSGHSVLCFASSPSAGHDGRPIKTLVGFQRVTLAPGESTVVSFDLTAPQLSEVDASGAHIVVKGAWQVFVEDAVANVTIQ